MILEVALLDARWGSADRYRCIACGAVVLTPFAKDAIIWERPPSDRGGIDVVCAPCALEREPIPPREVAEADQMMALQADPAEGEWLDRLEGRRPGEQRAARVVTAAAISAELAAHPSFTREMWSDLRPVDQPGGER